MADHWVLNASPVICLARAGLEDLLKALPDEAVIPQAVADEIAAGPAGDPAASLLSGGQFSIVPSVSKPEVLAWDLGRGETAVLSYVLANPGWIAILDDRAGRNCALSFSIQHKGTLAVVILARKRGIIPSAAAAMRSLRSTGLHLDDEIIQKALRDSVGEDW